MDHWISNTLSHRAGGEDSQPMLAVRQQSLTSLSPISAPDVVLRIPRDVANPEVDQDRTKLFLKCAVIQVPDKRTMLGNYINTAESP